MSQVITKPLILRIKCPVCNTVDEIVVKPEYFEASLAGIVRIPIEHRTPTPHMIIVDIDQHGFVRGSYLYRETIRPTTVRIDEIIHNLGEERIVYILYYLLRSEKIYLKGKEADISNVNRLLTLLNETHKLVMKPDKSVFSINLDRLKKPKAALRPLRQIILYTNGLSTNDAKAEWIRGEYSRLKKALEELRDVISMDRKWTLDELCGSLVSKINKDDLRLLLDILEDIGYRVSSKIKDAEYKVKSLFI